MFKYGRNNAEKNGNKKGKTERRCFFFAGASLSDMLFEAGPMRTHLLGEVGPSLQLAGGWLPRWGSICKIASYCTFMASIVLFYKNLGFSLFH